MESPIFSKRCAVYSQKFDPIRYWSRDNEYLPRISWVSWPLGSIKIFKNRLELTSLKKTIVLSYRDIEYFERRNFILYSVIVIKHKNRKLPKHIWIASIFTGLFFKHLKSVFAKNKIKVKFI
jgi:hypothetical protein